MNPKTVRARRPNVLRLTSSLLKKSHRQWYAILPNAGKEYSENARSIESFVFSLQRYFPSENILPIVDTTQVSGMHDRIFWNRLGRFIVEPYHLTSQLAGVLALDFVLRVNPEASVVVIPKASSLWRLRNTWYLFNTLKYESQKSPNDVVMVTNHGKVQSGLAARSANGRDNVRCQIASQVTFEKFWEPNALLVGATAETLWAHATRAMPELTRRIVEELRPTIRAVEAGRVDPKHVFLCLVHLYEAMDADASTWTTPASAFAQAGGFSEN